MEKLPTALPPANAGERSLANTAHSDDGRVERDPLTGFLTQSCFSRRLERLLNKRIYRETSLTLALLQLANFFEIASWVGTDQARLLLADLASLLKETVPDNSWLCRCRNHEIAVLLVGDGSRRSTLIGERIHQALQTRGHQLVPPQLKLACGIGLVAIGEGTPDAGIAFARARHDIWRRQQARLRWQQGQTAADSSAQNLPARLRAALQNDRFRSSFQAIASFRQDPLQRYELRLALSDEQGQLDPGSFLEIAIAENLGETLDRLVIAHAVALLTADQERCHQLTVNLSVNSLVSPVFPDWLQQNLPAACAGRLVLQASEIDLLISQHHLRRFGNGVRASGAQLGVNHFGATENSFRYLSLFPASVVKLDRSRVAQLAESVAQRQQLATLVKPIRAQGMSVIAPCVESIGDLPRLWQAGVNFVQGYCLHRPSSSRNFEFVEDIELSLN
jgi:EAL domain-containing protein (putative c-di-GMP-specific phosphodiesterase class I)/GGDEF domain-containing protein